MTVGEKSKTEAKLPLDSLEIKGYRCFKELTIPKLARVNLITGKNNVGKTSLLEAVHLWARRGSPGAFWTVLSLRAPIALQSASDYPNPHSSLLANLARLFYRARVPESITNHDDLTFSVGVTGNEPFTASIDWSNAVQIITSIGMTFEIHRIADVNIHLAYESSKVPTSSLMGTHGLDQKLLSSLWDNVALTAYKDDVLLGLRIIDDSVIDLGFFGDDGVSGGRYANIRRTGDSHPSPIWQLGEGMKRLLELIIVLVNSRNGILLIDEIENGLHYSVLTDVWRTIFDLANRLNVQVFATTHSWECIQAFEQALSSSDENDGELIRLEHKNETIVPTVFEKRRVKVVAEDWIEVR